MLVTQKTQRQNRLQNILFLGLFITLVGLLAWLSTRYTFEADWTASGRNSISVSSIKLLERLDKPVTVTSYATEDESVRQAISQLIGRYQRHKSDIDLHFINPDLEPATVRELGISVNGELVIEYQGRKENLQTLSEQGITNTLQRLVRGGERWLVFLEGHGERKPQGIANHDFGQWAQQLNAKGFKTQAHNLAENPQLPDNTQVLVIAGPQVNLLPGEVNVIKQYVFNGGSLLWLSDPGEQFGLEVLARSLGIGFEPGLIVDPTTRALGVSDPRFALVTDYPNHSISRNFDTLTLFPQAVGLTLTPPEGWEGKPFLRTQERSWSEIGEMSSSIRFDAGVDIAGPLTIGVALTRQQASSPEADLRTQQRVIVLGDGDFLSNAYLGNGGNLALGMNMVNWLAHDDTFINIPVKTTPDRNLQLSPLAQGVIGIGFLFLLPLMLAGTGFVIWWQRRKR